MSNVSETISPFHKIDVCNQEMLHCIKYSLHGSNSRAAYHLYNKGYSFISIKFSEEM
jgi:hypothetical protein